MQRLLELLAFDSLYQRAKQPVERAASPRSGHTCDRDSSECKAKFFLVGRTVAYEPIGQPTLNVVPVETTFGQLFDHGTVS